MASAIRNWFGGCRVNAPSTASAQKVITTTNTRRETMPVENKTSERSQQCLPTTMDPVNPKLETQMTPRTDGSTGIIARVSNAVSNFFNFKAKLRNYFYTQCKGKDASKPKEINKAMRTIGGQPLALKTSTGIETRGMQFTVDAFAQQMRSAGAQTVTLNRKDNSAAVPALVLDNKNSNYKALMNSLQEMGFFAKDRVDENGNLVKLDGVWEKREIDGKTYLWTKENFAKMNGCFRQGRFNTDKVTVDQASLKPFSARGTHTVVLNGGIYSRFESFRTSSEVAKFLALGINVVVSEDKNPGIIDTESRENVMANRDAIYKQLHAQGLRNDQIIWKGTCFSSIPAVEAAAKYAGSHVVIDQGYVSSADMVKKQLPTVLRPLSPLVRPAVKAFDFNYEMEPYLPQVAGSIAIITNNNDDKVPEGQLGRMQAVLDRKVDVYSINDRNVKHADGWFNDRKCMEQFTSHLMSNGWSTGEIIG